jgi:autophagy-related protein 16
MYEDMMERLKATRLEELAKQQVDGIVRQSEAGAELYVDSGTPSRVKHRIQAHESGGTAIAFETSSGLLYTGGNDRLVRQWDTRGGSPQSTLRGCLGQVLDLSVSMDNRQVLAACSDHKLYLWDPSSGRLKHTLTGHTEKVVGVDMSQGGGKRAVSASHDRTIKVWDLATGYGVNTIVCYSNCNTVCVTSDGALICSGHMDGLLRLWDIRSGKLANELAAHGQGITSVCLSRTGHTILTSGRDNVHNLFDVRSLDILDTFRSLSYRAATNWTRACLSSNEKYVVGGSADGTVVMWSRKSGESETLLKGGHAAPVLACAWSGAGKPLATADKSGRVCIWE